MAIKFLILLLSFQGIHCLAVSPRTEPLDTERLSYLSRAEQEYKNMKRYHEAYNKHMATWSRLEDLFTKNVKKDNEEKEKLAELQQKIADLEAEKIKALRELALGYYCSQCKRPKSQVERETKKSFTQHLKEVKGVSKPASRQMLLAKEQEYNDKIQRLKDKLAKDSKRYQASSENRWQNYEKSKKRFNDRARDLYKKFFSSKNDYKKYARRYYKLTILADKTFSNNQINTFRKTVTQKRDAYEKSVKQFIKSELTRIQKSINSGVVTDLDDDIQNLKNYLSDAARQFEKKIGIEEVRSDYLEAQSFRRKYRNIEGDRARSIKLRSKLYSGAMLSFTITSPSPLWQNFKAAIRSLESNKNKLKAAAFAQKALILNNRLVGGFFKRLRYRGQQLENFFSRSRQSLKDGSDSLRQWSNDNKLHYLKHMEYPDTINFLTNIIFEEKIPEEIEKPLNEAGGN